MQSSLDDTLSGTRKHGNSGLTSLIKSGHILFVNLLQVIYTPLKPKSVHCHLH